MSYEKGIVMKKKLRQESGAAAVEFAVILPLLILLLFGMLEFGILLYNKQVLTNASREGARAGIVVEVPKKTDADIKEIIKKYCNDPDEDATTPPLLINFNGASNMIDDSNIIINNPSKLFGEPLTVTVKYTYIFFVLSVIDAFGFQPFAPLELEATTIMKHE
jgi:Flp pilus assembly protein TadG